MTKKYFSANINWDHVLHHCIIALSCFQICEELCVSRNLLFSPPHWYILSLFFLCWDNDIGRQIHARRHLLHFPYLFDMAIVVEKLVHLQLFCIPMDCSPPGFSVHVILLARRILEWVAIPFSRGSSRPRDWTMVSCIAGRSFTTEPLDTAIRMPGYTVNTRWCKAESTFFESGIYNEKQSFRLHKEAEC